MFWTDSGKIELYSQKLAAQGFDPMPTWHDDEVEDPPQGYYRLLFGRAPVHTFGRTTNNRLLSEVMDENGVWVNREVAERWGLENGERVYLQNQDGVRSSFSAPREGHRAHPPRLPSTWSTATAGRRPEAPVRLREGHRRRRARSPGTRSIPSWAAPA